MKRILIFVAAVLGAVGIAGLGGLTAAAPAQASCAPGFTSIPCTIAEQVVQAPQDIAGGLAVAPGNLAGVGCAQPKPVGGKQYNSTCGLPSIANLANVGCPPDGDGNQTDPCGIPALPSQAMTGAQVIATAPVVTAVRLGQAPAELAGGLLRAPKQFADAITHGGTDPNPND
ncbi:MAG: hypothetical protein HYZ39_11075 [Mycolicibacterium cosmeticum]|nr:hypothetical protein [Mycolicibacterium cosmeticum]